MIGTEHPTFFIIEEGQANQGDYGLALRMIEMASRTGADAIEFQLAEADDFYVRSHPGHAIYRAREFSREQIHGLKKAAETNGILISASPLSERLIDIFSEAHFDLLTINASDIVNPRMLDAVVDSGLPFMVGTAMATVEEIDWAVNRLLRRSGANFCLLHGQHIMSTSENRGVPESEVSLKTIQYLYDRYRLPIGFTDHTSSGIVPALAAAHGAVVVTKHMSPGSDWQGPDWQVCLAPNDMARCVQLVRTADITGGGSQKKELATGERADRTQMRRSIIAKCDLPAGTVLKAEHLVLKRPGTGIDQRELETIIGKKLAVAVAEDEQIKPEQLI